jgi:hypothetical protein
MSITKIREDRMNIEIAYKKAWKEKEYNKIEEIMEKQKVVEERILNYIATN